MTVAKEIELEDLMKTWVLARPGSRQQDQGDVAGDKPLRDRSRRRIYREGLKNVTAGANPTSLQRGINKAVEAVVAELAKISKKVKDSSKIAQVATVSAINGTRPLVKSPDAMDKVGKDGTITVEEAKSMKPPPTLSKACSSTKAIFRRLRDERREPRGRSRERLHPQSREED